MGLFDALLSQEGVNLTGGGFVGAPDDKLMETRFDDMGNAYQVDVRMPLHQGHTKANSFNIPDNAQGLLQPEMPTESIDLGRQQVVQPSPQMMQPVPQSSFMPGSQESMAQNQQSTISPWSPEQTDYTDARNVMSGYKGGERLAQRDSGTFQDLTPNADPSQAMEMLAMFKKEGKALTDLQFEKAMGSLGMSDVLAENRSQINNVNESVNKLMNDNTNDFGEQVSADSFGQSDYDLNQQRQDTLDGLMMQDSVGERADNSMEQMYALNGTTPNVIPQEPTFKPDPTATDFWNEGAESTFNTKQTIAKIMGVGEDIVDKVLPMLGNTTPAILMNESHPRNQEAKDLFLNLTRGATQGLLHDLPQGTIDLGVDALNYGSNKLGYDNVIDPKDAQIIGGGYSEEQQKEFEDSTAYNLTKFGSQLVGGYAGLAKVMGNANSASKFTRFLKESIAVSMPGGTLDVTEGNISDLINTTEYKNAVTELMGSKVGDDASAEERFVARLKNMGEELTLGMSVPALYSLAKATKSALTDPQAMSRFMDKFPGLEAPVEKSMVAPGVDASTGVDQLGFYSEAENVLNKLKQETNLPNDVQRFMKKNGVTADEMQDTGLLGYLQTAKANDERVTKTGLLAHMDSNKTNLDETQHVGSSDEAGEQLEQLQLEDPSDNYTDDAFDNANFEVMESENLEYEVDEFFDYKIPQGDVYHENQKSIILNMNKLNTERYPVKAGVFDVDGNIVDENIPSWYKPIDNAIKEKDVDLIPNNLDNDFRDAVYEMKNEEYLENPYYEWNVGIDGKDFTAVGNEDVGIMITGPDGQHINGGGVYSINEANIQIREYAYDNDIGYSASSTTKYSDYTQPGLDVGTYREIPITSKPLGGDDYRGGHFEEDNVVGHLRVSDKTDVDGNKVLFIEELQSDWHQKGRKDGYDTKETKLEQQALAEKIKLHDDEYIVYEKKAKEVGLNFREGSDDASIFKNDELIGSIKTRDDNPVVRWTELAMSLPVNDFKVFDTLMGEVKEYVNRGTALRTESNKLQGGVPNAPLKNDKWQEMAFKRAMKIASDEGYDRVAWTNSQQQVDLYSERYRELYENTYDKKIPGIANKLAKKHGSQTGKTNIGVEESDSGYKKAEVNYIDITPELKTSIKGGQSMYGSTSVAKKTVGVSGGLLAIEQSQAEEGEGLLSVKKKVEKPMNGVLDGVKKPKVVRNVRSNNPGNIKDFGIKWNGMTGTESGGTVAEGEFVVFDKPENGIRALTRDLTNKRKRGLDTITKILNKYAPNGKENDTKSYIKDVARDVGIGATDKLSDKNMYKMIKAITKHEGGKKSLKHFSDSIIKKGMKSAYKNKYQKFK